MRLRVEDVVERRNTESCQGQEFIMTQTPAATSLRLIIGAALPSPGVLGKSNNSSQVSSLEFLWRLFRYVPSWRRHCFFLLECQFNLGVFDFSAFVWHIGYGREGWRNWQLFQHFGIENLTLGDAWIVVERSAKESFHLEGHTFLNALWPIWLQACLSC